MNEIFDLIVIGGGINGTAIAADAAGRGLSVLLCEKNDLASGTSSVSTKLIHGGLRYLEFYEFNVVRKSLREREVLMRRAANVIQPLEFVLPHERHLRPAWMIRLGLFLYDHLSKRNLIPASHKIDLTQDPRGQPLKESFKTGFSYYDCFTDDARLVVLNAISARENKAMLLTRTEFMSAYQENSSWHVLLRDQKSGQEKIVQSKGLINAAGPWVSSVQERIKSAPNPLSIKLDKGSHIIVPQLYPGNFAYILQNEDHRIVFTIPYQEKFTLIGTTDINYKKDLDSIHITEKEIDYLSTIISNYFKKTISSHDIVHSYSGVRCLQNDSGTRVSKLSRDYKFILKETSAPFLLTVIGGKLTTHRVLAEEALDLLNPFFPKMRKAWTASTPLPGCNFQQGNFAEFYQHLIADYPNIPNHLLSRYAHNYGTFAYELLEDAKSQEDLGEAFSQDLYEREVRYLIDNEWAQTSEDILWRRTKLGLTLSPPEQLHLSNWLTKK